MVKYTTLILKFDKKGEKTGWTYIQVPADIALKLKPNNKKSFRVKGKLDSFEIKAVAILPMGEGDFIMPINGTMRKGIGKRHGAQLKVQLEVDDKPLTLSPTLMACLADEPKAQAFFQKLPRSVQNYYSKWVESAKTAATQSRRIAHAVTSLSKYRSFQEMIRAERAEREKRLS